MQVGCDVDEDGHYHYTIVTTVNSGFRPDKVGKDTDAVFSPAVAASSLPAVYLHTHAGSGVHRGAVEMDRSVKYVVPVQGPCSVFASVHKPLQCSIDTNC